MRVQFISAIVAILASAVTLGVTAYPASAQTTDHLEVHDVWDSPAGDAR